MYLTVLTYAASVNLTAALTFILLALTFGGMILAGKEFQTYKFTGRKAHRLNSLLFSLAAAVAFFSLVFLMNGAMWILGAALIMIIFMTCTTIADQMKDRMQR